MDLDKLARTSPRFTFRNIFGCMLGIIMIVFLVAISTENYRRNTVCDRVLHEPSGWIPANQTRSYISGTCEDFFAQGFVPCSIKAGAFNDPPADGPFFCEAQNPGWQHAEDAPVVVVYNTEQAPNGALIRVGEFLHSSMTFY